MYLFHLRRPLDSQAKMLMEVFHRLNKLSQNKGVNISKVIMHPFLMYSPEQKGLTAGY